jgi:hypothetical protein
MKTIRKLIVSAAAAAIATAAIATAVLPPSSFAKTSHKVHKVKEPLCSYGQACTNKPTGVSKATGWVTTQRCSYESHKMYADLFPCYRPGGACPAATCKSKKK